MRKFFFAVLAMALVATSADAAFQIRATAFDSTGKVTGVQTAAFGTGPGSFISAAFQSVTANAVSGNFDVVATNNTSTLLGQTVDHGGTINIRYLGLTGAASDRLLIEIIGDGYSNIPPGLAQISSNGSPSTSGLAISSITMKSSVINGTVALLAAPIVGSVGYVGNTAGLLGTTTGVGASGTGTSGILAPNPANGANFSVASPFSFYQNFLFTGFTTTGQNATLSFGSTVSAVPAPAGLVLALAGMPVLGLASLRRRRAAKAAV